MFKIALNPNKPYNYAFFCPVSRLHLTVSNPVGFVHEVTPAIFRGLRNKSLLDVDGAIDLATGASVESGQTQASLPQNPPEPPADEPKDLSVTDDTGKKKRGRKANPKAVKQDAEPQEEPKQEDVSSQEDVPAQEETPVHEKTPEPQEEPKNLQVEPEALPASPEEVPNDLFEGIEQ